MQVVKISLFESQCSGIIISCNNYSEEGYMDYLIITVSHLCGNLFEKIEEKNQQNNIGQYICFDIFNKDKYLINRKDYEIKDYFISDSLLDEDDILCFHIKIKDIHNIDGKATISKSDYLGNVLTEGFPNIGNSQVIDLKGIVCKKNYEVDYIFSYRISDDYHYYESISDLRVMEGLSGAPVLTEKNEILGINQSIPYFSNGENPFKIINYIDINHILNHLRENNCIVYSLIDEDFKIKWIKNNDENIEEISAMVIGGSGAGKSSFICQFIYDNDIIDSSGDGQTTRSDIIYNLSVKNNGRVAKIFLLNDNDGESIDENKSFPLKCFNNINLELITFIFKYRYSIPEYDIFSDNYIYFKKLHYFFDVIIEVEDDQLKDKIKKTLKEVNDFILSDYEKDNNEIYSMYIEFFILLDEIKGSINPQLFKIMLNSNLILDLLKQHEYAKIISDVNESDVNESDVNESDVNEKCMNDFNGSSESKNIDKYSELLKEMYIFLKKNIHNYESIFGEKAKEIIKKYDLSDDLYNKDMEKILLNQNGNFEIEEFNFLDKANKAIKVTEISESEFKNIKNIIQNCNINKEKEFESIENNVKKIYKNIYNQIQKNLIEYFEINSSYGVSIKLNDKKSRIISIEFDFNFLTCEEIELLKYCLKVYYINEKEKKSLTAIIDKVEIDDILSNDYAYLADDLGLKRIIFHDTRGLDHIEKGVDKKIQLRNYLTNLEENNSQKKRIDAVFYIKKLDSGRPTELENTIPFIYDIIPNIPFFCLFTGIDILGYKKDSIIDWYKDASIRPNSVKYLFSKDLDNVFEKLSFSQNRKNSVKKALQKNIGAFCAIENYRNNLLSIEKIIKSILMKEIDSIDIVEQSTIDRLSTSNQQDPVNKEIEKLLFIFFSRCVVNWKYVHYRTSKSNAQRIHTGEVLGYWGTYRHRWDLIFNDSYVDIFKDSNYTSNFLSLFEKNREKIEAALINVQNNFLGDSCKIYKYDEKNKFIEVLKTLYQDSKDCPFDKKEESLSNLTPAEAKDYLNNIQNFPELIKGKPSVLEDFAELFLYELKYYLEKNREDSIKKIIKYNEILNKSGRNFINEISRIFGDDVSNDSKLNIIMTIVKSIQK